MTTMDWIFLTLALAVTAGLFRAGVLVALFQADCPHKTVSFPMRRADGIDRCSCLECGKVLEYKALTKCDWLN